MGKAIYGLYDDDHKILTAATNMAEKGIKINEVYSPFPIHGMDKVLGMKPTRMAVCAFMCGITGTILALLGVWYFMVYDWPLNIGGKPNFELYTNLPSFVPIIFEFSVLCAAHCMVLIMMLRNWTMPGVTARNPHPRTTDDHFAMEVHPAANHSFSEDELRGMMTDSGAIETFDK